jgi:VanZ family protein
MLTNNLLGLKKKVFGLALGWTVLIAILCLVKFGSLPTVRVTGADKYVHFTLHFVFTLLWGYYVRIKHKTTQLKPVVKVYILSILYGILIEISQETLTATRHADIFDVMANTTGATTALFFFVLLAKIQKKRIDS